MKVYLATAGEYSDFRVQAVFANRPDAEAHELADDVMEYEVHEGPIEVRTWHELRWHSWQEDREVCPGVEVGNPVEYTRRHPFDHNPKRVTHEWNRFGKAHPGDWLVLVVEGWDLAAVGKVFSEQRTQYEATRPQEGQA
ncbi:hypothetical protein AB0I72_19275 [Nocardiopsis sp. NPDC049922]|uniref:hypothetical protein n=1 Tax=Nocardiopsis sp. NPDC049922 TaxID=3155157 RepID=UPI0033F6A402